MIRRYVLARNIKRIVPDFTLSRTDTIHDLEKVLNRSMAHGKVLPPIGETASLPRPHTKAHVVLEGLVHTGLTIDDIRKMTGWKNESAYGAIHEDVRRRYGLAVKHRKGVYKVTLPRHMHM